MSNFLMLVFCLAAGMLLRRAGRAGNNAHQALNAVIVHQAPLSVGMQLRLDAIRERSRALALGLGYKRVLAPALVVGVLWLFGAAPDMASRVSVIEAAMPPMIGAGAGAGGAREAGDPMDPPDGLARGSRGHHDRRCRTPPHPLILGLIT